MAELAYDNARTKLKLTGVLLKQDKVTYNHGPIVNIYIVYRLIPNSVDFGLTVENSVFGAVKLTKSVDISKYKFLDMVLDLIQKEVLHIQMEDSIIFGADLSSSKHGNNKTRSILVLGKDFMQGIENTTIYAENVFT